MISKILPDFQEFLTSRAFVDKKHAPFYARWVSKFLAFSNKDENLGFTERKEKFLDYLSKTTGFADWQKEQAKTALEIYFEQFNPAALKLYAKEDPRISNANLDLASILKMLSKALRIKHYSYKTERSYINWAKRFHTYVIEVKKKDVQKLDLSSENVRDYLGFLALRKKVSSSTQNQAFNALLFLFRDVLNIKLEGLGNTVRAKRGPRLPVVLTPDEVKEIFRHVSGKNRLILQLFYGTGMRLTELTCLRVKDIDFESGLIFIKSGKGDKDRITILPEYLKEELNKYVQEVKKLHEKDLAAGYGEAWLPNALGRKYPKAAKEFGWQFAFPSTRLSPDHISGKIRRFYISPKTIQNTMSKAVKKAGIVKHATVHTLRHSFATHLLANGVNIREVQNLLGHKNVETTMVYTHVLRSMSNVPKSPLDILYTKQP